MTEIATEADLVAAREWFGDRLPQAFIDMAAEFRAQGRAAERANFVEAMRLIRLALDTQQKIAAAAGEMLHLLDDLPQIAAPEQPTQQAAIALSGAEMVHKWLSEQRTPVKATEISQALGFDVASRLTMLKARGRVHHDPKTSLWAAR